MPGWLPMETRRAEPRLGPNAGLARHLCRYEGRKQELCQEAPTRWRRWQKGVTGWRGVLIVVLVLTRLLRRLGLGAGLMSLTMVSTAQTSAPATVDILVSNRDLSVDPGKDFFTYANGGWLARNPIPVEESGWGDWQPGGGGTLCEAAYDQRNGGGSACPGGQRPAKNRRFLVHGDG